jgi:hypothetical protein
MQRVGFAAEIDQPIGLACHGRYHHCHFMPGGLLALDNAGNAADAFRAGHRRATEFHYDPCHPVRFPLKLFAVFRAAAC